MTPPDRPPDLSDLLAHAGGLEALARRLVGASGADDLVQDTWVAALRGPPREGGPLGPWLRTVLRRLARDRVRGDVARRARQEAVSRMEGTGDTHELVARAELHELLLRAVLELDEPYRGVLLLRYFEDLSPTEIAERRGVPASTVRTQLERGLARVRERLDARPGGRGAWQGMVVAALGVGVLSRAAEASAMGAGGLSFAGGTMAAAKVVVAAAAGAAVIGAIVWTGVTLRQQPAERPEVAVAAAEPSVRAAPIRTEEDFRPAATPEREARQALVATPEAVAVETPTEVAPASTVRLRARVVDGDGRGIGGAELSLVDPVASRTTARTDAWGEVTFEAPFSSDVRTGGVWQASAPGYATRRAQVVLTAGAAISLGTIELGPGGAVEGYVRREDGSPAPNARVVAVHPVRDPGFPDGSLFFATRTEDREVRTDDLGHYRLDGVALGPTRVWARDRDHDWTRSAVVEVVGGGDVSTVDVVLAKALTSRIRGRVIDPSGEPVPRATIHVLVEAADMTAVSSRNADANGMFEYEVTHALPHHFTARHREGEFGEVTVRDVSPGTHDLVLQLVPVRTITLRVRDPEGRPVTSYAIQAMLISDRHSQPLFHVPEASRPDGEHALRLPAVPFALAVEARGHQRVLRQGLVPEQMPDVFDVVLAKVPGVHGRVLHRGRPVADASVELLLGVADNSVLHADGLRSFVQTTVPFSVKTDESGAFRLDLRDDGRWVIVARKEGLAPARHGPVQLEAARGAEGIELVLVEGGAIEGRVLTPPGADPEGTIVGFTDGFGSPRSIRAGPGGAYRVEGLAPGRWQVRRLESELLPFRTNTTIRPGTVPFDTDCTVVDGETTRFDLDLTDRVKIEFDGELVAPGLALAGWVASLEVVTVFESQTVGVATLDANGRFRIEAPAGKYRLMIVGGCGGGARLALSENVDFAPGNERWRREIATGRAEGRIDLARFSDHVAAEMSLGGELQANVSIQPRADGSFGPLVLPVGNLVVRPRALDGTWIEPSRYRFRIDADRTTEIDVR